MFFPFSTWMARQAICKRLNVTVNEYGNLPLSSPAPANPTLGDCLAILAGIRSENPIAPPTLVKLARERLDIVIDTMEIFQMDLGGIFPSAVLADESRGYNLAHLPEIIGFDLGNVLYHRPAGSVEAEIDEKAVQLVHYLSATRFGDDMHVISRISRGNDERVLNKLLRDKFPERTGIPEHNISFCYERSEKAPKAKARQFLYFLDDRPEVLKPMAGSVPNLIVINPTPNEVAEHPETMEVCQRVDSTVTALYRLLDPADKLGRATALAA